MATTPELPTKRAVEVVASGSGLEASKKAKLGTGGDYSEFHSFDEFFDRYGDSFQNARHEWRRHLCQLQRECQIREVQLYLVSSFSPHSFLPVSLLLVNSQSPDAYLLVCSAKSNN